MSTLDKARNASNVETGSKGQASRNPNDNIKRDFGKERFLYTKYVGAGEIDFVRLRDVIRRECLVAERGIITVSRGLLRELRADRAYIGKLWRVVQS